jgi:iron complex outermembrane recepter protein
MVPGKRGLMIRLRDGEIPDQNPLATCLVPVGIKRHVHPTSLVRICAPLFAIGTPRAAALFSIGLFTLNVSSAQVARTASVQTLKKLSLEELTEIPVTSVSRAPQRLSETASAIQVVTQEEIRRFAPTTLPEALQLANNLNVARKNSHDWAISARGFNTDLANKLLVMIDGRTVYTPLFSGVRWDVQDYVMEDIERIEVVSGPGGTLWGANAVNGVINVISKSAADTQGLYLAGMGGTQVRQLYTARYGGAIAPNVHYRVYAKYADRDTEHFANGREANDAWSRHQIGFRMDADPASGTALTFQGDYYRGDEGYVGGGEARVSGSNLLGRWSSLLANGSDLSVQIYFNREYLKQPVPASAFSAAGMFEDTLDTYDLDFQHRWAPNGQQRLVWGFGYRLTDERSSVAPGLAFVPRDSRQELFSGFVQDEIALRPNLTLTVGAKVERTHYTGWDAEPTIRLQWEMSAHNMIWGAVSRAVRTPSRIDRDLLQPSRPPIVLRGGADYDSEKLMAYELGYRTTFSRRMAASLAAFYHRYDDIRSARPTPTTVIPLVFANDLEADTYGFELTTTFQATEQWRLTAGYNLLKEDVRVKNGRTDFNNALNETSDPKHQMSLRSSMDLGKAFEWDANLRWVDTLQTHDGPRRATVPSYVELDLRLGWHMGRNAEFSIVGRNLLHDRHPEYGPPSPTRVELGRSAYAKIAWRF